MRFSYSLLIIFPLTFLFGCGIFQDPLKDAKTYEEAGMYSQAFEVYKNRFESKADAEALIGMKQIGQRLLNKEYDEAYQLYNRGMYDEAEGKFAEAEKLKKEFEYYRLNLATDPIYQNAIEDVSFQRFEAYYREAEQALLAADFETADLMIRKLRGLRRQDKRIEYLEILSSIYPSYLEGKNAMDLGLYRQAFVALDKVCKIDAGFRNAFQLREDARAILSYTMAYLTIGEGANSVIESTIATRVKQGILSLEDPFITLLERDDIIHIIEEQRLNMEAGIDENSAIKAGKLLGAQYLLTGEILAYEDVLSDERVEERLGYLGRTTKSKKVKFLEFEQRRKTSAVFRFQIIDSESGVVYAAETLPFEMNDVVHYATFNGEDGELYPGVWTSKLIPMRSDEVYGYNEKKKLEELLKAPQNPRSGKIMEQAVIEMISSAVIEKVKAFRPPIKRKTGTD